MGKDRSKPPQLSTAIEMVDAATQRAPAYYMYRALVESVSTLNVLGGCCGTDHRHIEEICKAI
jgi:methionine synthase I (cobalamin-dependent)